MYICYVVKLFYIVKIVILIVISQYSMYLWEIKIKSNKLVLSIHYFTLYNIDILLDKFLHIQ